MEPDRGKLSDTWVTIGLIWALGVCVIYLASSLRAF